MKFSIKNIFNNVPPQHRGKVYGAIIGLILGILFLILGFWRVLLLGIFVALGFLIGYVLDTNSDIRERIVGFFEKLSGRDDRYF